MTEQPLDWEDQLQDVAADQTRNDRFSSLLVIIVVLLFLSLGLVNRQRIDAQLWNYNSRISGIEATYPAGWLVDESGDYVVRMRDPRARPFKTQYQVKVVPAGGQTSIRNVLDGLTLQRSSDLAAFRVLSVEDISIGTTTLTRLNFAFVDADPNPFIQRLPVVVKGIDVLVRDGDRVIVVTFMSEEDTFDQNQPDFDRFLQSLRY
jgi:hypothetical protein